MNTKTMRLPPRRVLTPSGTTNKRKEREDSFERPKPVTTNAASKFLRPDRPNPRPGPEPMTTTTTSTSTSTSGGGGGSKGLESLSTTLPSNQLLAGYLAHEYLTKGTLMGQPWAPSRAEGPTIPIEKKKEKAGEDTACGGERGDTAAPAPCRRTTATEEVRERYAKVAGLMMGGGTHLPGVVNPTQLARFLYL